MNEKEKDTVANDSNSPLISVIVPIYNVEKYVRKCLDSLMMQTMRQIEVICIDDGSTDNSGKIADGYVEKNGWPRVRVIHTENRGLSAARNRGINEARTQWLMFVDSDDYVDKDFCMVPYKTALANDADFVKFGLYRVSRWGEVKSFKYDGPTGILDNVVALEYIGSVAWNKLYKKELFNGIRYPEGRVYEDSATTYKLAHKAKQIVILKERLYFYQWRRNSISQLHTAKIKQDAAVSEWEKYCDLRECGYPEQKLENIACSAAIGILINIEKENPTYQEAEKIIASICGIPKYINGRKKIALAIWKINPYLFNLLCRALGRRDARIGRNLG